MGVLRVKGASFFVVVFFSFAAKKTRSIRTIPGDDESNGGSVLISKGYKKKV
jgi:hypothetical protein